MGKKLVSLLAPVALAVCLILADGCGAYNPNGTGSGGTGGSNPGQAQGFYSCMTETGFPMTALIMPNDVLYGVIFQSLQSGSSIPVELIAGQGASGNDTYTGTLSGYVSTQTPSSATVKANDVPRTSISGTITSSTEVGFGGAALPTTSYQFSTPGSISTIAGTWTGTLLDGTQLTLSITTSGSITTTTSSGCKIGTTPSGPLTASTSNNLFTATLAFSSSCAPALAGQSSTAAVAMVFTLPNTATPQLIITATIGSTAGTVFTAQP